MEQMITCINCPVGCQMNVQLSDDHKVLSVTGNTCPRGAKYAIQECTAPERMVTAVIPVAGSWIPLSVKSAAPVPKKMIRDVMKALSSVAVSLPVHAGDVVVRNILGTGTDIVATRSLTVSDDRSYPGTDKTGRNV